MNGRIPSKIVRLLSFSLLLVPVALRGQDDLTEKSKRIQAFLFAGKFDEAEPLVRECLRQVPEVLYFLSQLDMVLPLIRVCHRARAGRVARCEVSDLKTCRRDELVNFSVEVAAASDTPPCRCEPVLPDDYARIGGTTMS